MVTGSDTYTVFVILRKLSPMTDNKSKRNVNWSIIIALTGIALTAIYKFYPVEAGLKYNILANTSVLDLKAEVAKLQVSYDSIDLLKSKQNQLYL